MPPALAHGGGDLLGDRAFVEAVRPVAARWLAACRRDRAAPAGRRRQQRAVAVEKNRAPRTASAPAAGCASGSESAMIVFDREAVARERDRRRDQIGEREFAGAVFLHAPARAPRPCRARRSTSAESRDFCGSALPCASRNIVCGRRGRRGLAIVDRGIVAGLGEMDHHEAAAADIAGARIGHRHREADRDRGIDRVAAAIENIDADAGGALLLRHHHAVVARDRLRRRDDRRARDRRDLRVGGGAEERARQKRDGAAEHHGTFFCRPRGSGDAGITNPSKSCGIYRRSLRITALAIAPARDRPCSAACRSRRRRGSTC